MPQFTNYHQSYEPAWRHLFFERAKWDPTQPKVIVEVGSYEGSSTWWIMNHLLTGPEGRLYCIDAWAGEGGEARYQLFLRNIAELPDPGRIEVVRDWSQNALRALIARGVRADVLYVDGGHDAPTVLRDLVTGFDLLKPGGLLICDDYLWDDPKWGGDKLQGRPKMAIDAFTTIYADKLRFIRGMPLFQVFLQKTAD